MTVTVVQIVDLDCIVVYVVIGSSYMWGKELG